MRPRPDRDRAVADHDTVLVHPSSRARRPAARSSIGLALAVLLPGCVSACEQDGPPVAALDQVFAGRQVPGGSRSTFRVPGRRIVVTVTDLRDRLPDDVQPGSTPSVDPDAAPGRAFVGVGVSSSHLDDLALGPHDDLDPRIDLLVDGEPVVLGDGVHSADVTWVTVPAAADLGLAVDYDGFTQTVEDATRGAGGAEAEPPIAGRALSTLYDGRIATQEISCMVSGLPGAGLPETLPLVGDCSLEVSDPLPFYGEQGWAPPGRAWVWAQMNTPGGFYVTATAAGRPVAYEVSSRRPVLHLDGRAARAVPETGDEGVLGWRTRFLFLVDDDAHAHAVSWDQVYAASSRFADEADEAGAPRELRRHLRGRSRVTVG